jgi:hypothetical protein
MHTIAIKILPALVILAFRRGSLIDLCLLIFDLFP